MSTFIGSDFSVFDPTKVGWEITFEALMCLELCGFRESVGFGEELADPVVKLR